MKHFSHLILCIIFCAGFLLSTAQAFDDYVGLKDLHRSQVQADINLQHSMAQDHINMMNRYQDTRFYNNYSNSNSYNNDRIERPTYVIDKPLYRFGE